MNDQENARNKKSFEKKQTNKGIKKERSKEMKI